jgi:hypothetical protein
MAKAASQVVQPGRGVGRAHSTAEGGESRWREGALLEDATPAGKELEIVATLRTPEKLRELQRALYLRAKKEPSFRAYALYDKVYRGDVLAHAYALVKANGGDRVPTARLWKTSRRMEARRCWKDCTMS